MTKKDFQIDPVTKIDIEMERLIRKLIRLNLGNHNIIGEELEDEIEVIEVKSFVSLQKTLTGVRGHIMTQQLEWLQLLEGWLSSWHPLYIISFHQNCTC